MDDKYLTIEDCIVNSKLIERKLMKNNKILKETVEILKNTQKQMVQQEKLAAIGQLSAGIAHEINNPLGFICSNFETSVKYFNQYKEMINIYKDFIDNIPLCSEHSFKIAEIKKIEQRSNIEFISNDIEELFDDIADGLKRISEIVNGLKTFSRMDSNEEFGNYDLNNAIKNTMLLAKSYMKYYVNNIEELGDIPIIQAKGDEINQVLLNIVLNATHAIKAKKQNHLGDIIVRTDLFDGFVRCQIEDNGTGIEEENINKIFDPFFTTKAVGQGTGLGLSIAHDIVTNKHNGKMLVESEIGVGTKFTILLPIEQKVQQE